MIDIKIEIPPNFLADEVERVEKQSVYVGYGSQSGQLGSLRARIPDRTKPLATGLPEGRGGGASLQRSTIKRNGYADVTTKQIAGWLDKKYHFISKPFIGASNIYVEEIANEFAKTLDPSYRIHTRRLENAAIALIRNPVIAGEYGHNHAKTVKEKGFDHLMIDTGSTMARLQAKYYKD